MTDNPAPGCACGEGEPAADPRAPPTARRACGCEGLPKISGGCDSLGSRSGVTLFPGTSQDRSISSRSLALSFFECFAPFLPFSRQRSNASTSLSALVSARSSSTISSRSSSGAREYRHVDDSSWKRTRRRKGTDAMTRHGGDWGGGWSWAGRRYNPVPARKEVVHKAGWIQPQLAERTAQSAGTARGQEGWQAPSRTTRIHVAEGAA